MHVTKRNTLSVSLENFFGYFNTILNRFKFLATCTNEFETILKDVCYKGLRISPSELSLFILDRAYTEEGFVDY